jgi:glucosamine--fructose-6-phosphate aminotransferase (isomerizing)
MCGIIGYVGNKKASDILVSGLSHLEYRGYDSSGVALCDGKNIEVYKAQGKLINLVNVLKDKNETCESSFMGIGHIRWATHGLPTTTNAHPHTCNCENLTLVHNGIIENYQELKQELQMLGCIFKSQTDTEVAAHLIAHEYGKVKDLLVAMQNAVKKIQGAFAFCVMHKKEPDKIVIAKRNAPLIVGVGEGENFVAFEEAPGYEISNKGQYHQERSLNYHRYGSI